MKLTDETITADISEGYACEKFRRMTFTQELYYRSEDRPCPDNPVWGQFKNYKAWGLIRDKPVVCGDGFVLLPPDRDWDFEIKNRKEIMIIESIRCWIINHGIDKNFNQDDELLFKMWGEGGEYRLRDFFK